VAPLLSGAKDSDKFQNAQHSQWQMARYCDEEVEEQESTLEFM